MFKYTFMLLEKFFNEIVWLNLRIQSPEDRLLQPFFAKQLIPFC
jgi:hypothetical protein